MNTTIRPHIACAPLVVTDDDRCLTRVPWGETVAELRAFAGHLESKANHAFSFDKRIILQVDIDDTDMKFEASTLAARGVADTKEKTRDGQSRVSISI